MDYAYMSRNHNNKNAIKRWKSHEQLDTYNLQQINDISRDHT